MIENVDDEEIEERLLAGLRRARFGEGIRCPHCGGTRVHRWGTFSRCRQRYRCCGCKRTFSDLTRTPAVYSKKLPLWLPYAGCLASAVSVRLAANRVGIHPSTAFRWRHAINGWLRDRDAEELRGWFELANVWMPESRKGQRRLDRPARRRGIVNKLRYRITLGGAGIVVRVACDRTGHVVAGVTAGDDHVAELVHVLDGRYSKSPSVTIEHDRLGSVAGFARSSGLAFVDSHLADLRQPRSLAGAEVVRAYVRRWMWWMPRFRGVATKYLPNYLHWHRLQDSVVRHGTTAAALRWPVGSGYI